MNIKIIASLLSFCTIECFYASVSANSGSFIHLEDEIQKTVAECDIIDERYDEIKKILYLSCKNANEHVGKYIRFKILQNKMAAKFHKIMATYYRSIYSKTWFKLKEEALYLITQLTILKYKLDSLESSKMALKEVIENESNSHNSINIDKKILSFAHSIESIDKLVINLDAEMSIGVLSDINFANDKFNFNQINKPTAGKGSMYGSELQICAYPNSFVFAIGSGIVIFSSKFIDYASLVVIVHNQDYKSVIYGDFEVSTKVGDIVLGGGLIGKVLAKHNPIISLLVYYKDKKIFSTKTVDNFVENASR